MNPLRRSVFFVTLAFSLSTDLLVVAQQTPSTVSPAGEADSVPQERRNEPAGSLQSARSFQGRIVKLGREFVLRNVGARTNYHLDDQNKARHFSGKRVKVTATLDSVSNTLPVIDIEDWNAAR